MRSGIRRKYEIKKISSKKNKINKNNSSSKLKGNELMMKRKNVLTKTKMKKSLKYVKNTWLNERIKKWMNDGVNEDQSIN